MPLGSTAWDIAWRFARSDRVEEHHAKPDVVSAGVEDVFLTLEARDNNGAGRIGKNGE
jgi:hypothetical protein